MGPRTRSRHPDAVRRGLSRRSASTTPLSHRLSDALLSEVPRYKVAAVDTAPLLPLEGLVKHAARLHDQARHRGRTAIRQKLRACFRPRQTRLARSSARAGIASSLIDDSRRPATSGRTGSASASAPASSSPSSRAAIGFMMTVDKGGDPSRYCRCGSRASARGRAQCRLLAWTDPRAPRRGPSECPKRHNPPCPSPTSGSRTAVSSASSIIATNS